ncbi:MAG TPA: 6-phosphogluconolactonase [Gemmatimonadales bacterium]|nr:6-phosphogluconolactonase [Gemmatimonadales bacterium]
MPRDIVIEAGPALADAAARWIAAAIEADIRERGRSAVALSGGRTPQPVYERLAEPPLASRIAWRSVEIYFGDERAVPPTDPRSNYAMAKAALLDRVNVPAAQIHRMEAERSDRDAAARDYERLLPERLDLLLLGMGADGHTASLFPGSPALDQHRRRIVPATGPTPPRERLTITPPVIAQARRVAVLVAGAEKAATVARALRSPSRRHDLPVQLALGGTWFVDRDAAAHLSEASA